MNSFPPIKEQLRVIKRGTIEIVPEDELILKLKRSIKDKKPLRVKLGVDPTRPDLHLGHSVILRKLRQFQDLGHEAILIIGGFTAMIGDPTGQNKTRPPLSPKEVEENATTYIDQAKKILDPTKTVIVNNYDWLGALSFMDLVHLSSKVTVARMIERDDFSKRFNNNEPISLHEFLYPLAQGQDSVHLKSDIELGGTDQKFNLLVGRDLQRSEGQEPQVCLMMPLLEGTDGKRKMSKSYDNYIGIDETPNEIYGKTLSIPDDLIYTYFELLTDLSDEELARQKENILSNPRNAKHDLALTLTRMYYDSEAANEARHFFEMTVVNKDIPDDAPIISFTEGSVVKLIDLISNANLSPSNAETKRLMKQGGVSLDNVKIYNIHFELLFKKGESYQLRVGKRKFARLLCL